MKSGNKKINKNKPSVKKTISEKPDALIKQGKKLKAVKQKKIEVVLTPDHEQLQSILRTAMDGFWILNYDGKFLQVNETACKMLGYTSEELLDMNLKDIEFQENPSVSKAHMAKIIANGRDRFVSKHRCKNGQIIDVEVGVTWQPEHNTFFAFIHDMRDRISVEKALKESEEKYRNLFEKSKDAILILENGKFVDCNQATIDMLGYKDKSLFLRTHPSELSPEKQSDGRFSVEKADEMIRIAVEKGSNRFEWDHVKANGEIFPVEVLLTRITTEKETEIIHTVWRDISERRRDSELQSVLFQISQAAHYEDTLKGLLQVVHSSLSKFLDTTNFYVAIYDETKNKYSFPYYKDEFDEISEFESLELNYSLTDYVRRKGKPLFADTETTELLVAEGELKLVGSDSPIWIGAPLKVSKKTIGVVAVQDYHDSTKYTERDLELLNFVSDNIASAIGKKIADEALQKSELELKKINADKDKLFSVIAHDLRSPFNSLLGSTGFLANEIEDLDKDEIKEFADNINKSATLVFRLLENLLQWSRYQTGRINYSPKKYYLKDQVDEALELFSVSAIRKQITFVNKISRDQKIYADKDMIEIVLRNLFSNALKYSSKGGEIKVDCAEVADKVEITVADNGKGMSEETLNSLFVVGNTDSTPGTENERGTGLGLLLCKDFIEMNKGKIWVRSELGKGSRFTFNLPKSEKS